MTAASTTSAKFDAGLCREALSLQFEPGAVVEVRIPKTNRGVVSGYYDDFERLVRDVARMSGDVPGVYITMNQVDPRLLARSRNRPMQRPENTTSDKDILSI